MRNASPAFEILTRNSSLAHYQFLVFQTPSEMGIKALRVRYAEFIASMSGCTQLLSISIKMVQKIEKCESCFWNFNSNLELIAFLHVRFQETYGDVYVENKMGQVKFITLLSILKEYCCYESKKFRKMRIESVAFGLRTRNLN